MLKVQNVRLVPIVNIIVQDCTKITVDVNEGFFLQEIEIKHVLSNFFREFLKFPKSAKHNVFLRRKCELTAYFVQCQCQRQTNE